MPPPRPRRQRPSLLRYTLLAIAAASTACSSSPRDRYEQSRAIILPSPIVPSSPPALAAVEPP